MEQLLANDDMIIHFPCQLHNNIDSLSRKMRFLLN